MSDKSKPAEAMVEAVALALWQRERERAAHCDALLGAVRGQAIKPTMDPFEDHRDMWMGDARAAIAAHWSALAPVIAEAFRNGVSNAPDCHTVRAAHEMAEAYANRILSTLRGETTI